MEDNRYYYQECPEGWEVMDRVKKKREGGTYINKAGAYFACRNLNAEHIKRLNQTAVK